MPRSVDNDTMNISDSVTGEDEELLLDDDGNQIDEDGEIVKTKAELEAEIAAEEDDDADEEADDRGDKVDDEDLSAEDLEAIADGDDKGMRKRLNHLVATNKKQADALAAVPDLIAKIASGSAAAPAKKADEPPAYDFKAKARERNKALLDGDEDKAAELDDEIAEARSKRDRAIARAEAVQEMTAVQEQRELTTVIAGAFEKYPFLSDGNADVYNEDALDEVMMFRNHYFSKGDCTLPEALQKAIDKVCPQYVESGEENEDEDVGAAGKKQSALRARLAAAKKARTLRNAGADTRTPPQLSKAGISNRGIVDYSKIKIEDLSDEEFEALPPAVKQRLRGDKG